MIGLVLVGAPLGACSTSVPIRSPGVRMETSGSGPALVFAPESEGWATGWEWSRRDGDLGPRAEASALEARAWPETPRPSLDRARRLHLWDRRADTHVYFRTTP